LKILKVPGWLLRIPSMFPLVKAQQHAFAILIEIETEDGAVD